MDKQTTLSVKLIYYTLLGDMKTAYYGRTYEHPFPVERLTAVLIGTYPAMPNGYILTPKNEVLVTLHPIQFGQEQAENAKSFIELLLADGWYLVGEK